MPISDDDIDDAAGKPKSVTSHDGRSITQHSPKELVEAQRLQGANDAADAATAKPRFGVRFSKIVPPGCG